MELEFASGSHRFDQSQDIDQILRLIADDALEFSAHTSILQVLFSIESILKLILETEFPRSSIGEKIRVIYI